MEDHRKWTFSKIDDPSKMSLVKEMKTWYGEEILSASYKELCEIGKHSRTQGKGFESFS